MKKNKKWGEIYAEWKALHPLISDDGRHALVRGCIRKYAMPNVLIAWEAARRTPIKKGRHHTVYKCEICGYFHLGHRKGK